MTNHGLLGETKGIYFEGYEIHRGRTKSEGGEADFHIYERYGQACDILDGCLEDGGHVLGTYIHGLFHNQELRRAILRYIASSKGFTINLIETGEQRDKEYDSLADLIRRSLDMRLVYNIMG